MPPFLPSTRFLAAIEAFDLANSGDPNRESDGEAEFPREVLYARRLTAWVLELNPDAPETLRLAARCQHLGRWEIPRDRYPADRAGYLRWRKDLQQHHARRSGEILTRVGYDPDSIARVQSLNLKRDLGRDPDCQTLEDALCLVFLQFQAADLVRKLDREKLVNALRKSWAKMSPAGREAALRLPPGGLDPAWLTQALTPPDSSPAPATG